MLITVGRGPKRATLELMALNCFDTRIENITEHCFVCFAIQNRIFPSLVQFPVSAPYSRTSCDVICNVIGHFGLRDSVFRRLRQGSKTKQKNKQTKKMFLFYSFTNSFSDVKIVYSMGIYSIC